MAHCEARFWRSPSKGRVAGFPLCCICLSAWAALRQPLPPSLRLFYFLVSLCQLQRCPTYRCLPSLHLTACLKKINISAGREAKASIWCVYLGCRWTPEHAAQRCIVPLFHPLLSLSSFFFLLFFFFAKILAIEEEWDVSAVKSRAMIPLNKAWIFHKEQVH